MQQTTCSGIVPTRHSGQHILKVRLERRRVRLCGASLVRVLTFSRRRREDAVQTLRDVRRRGGVDVWVLEPS